ncbi:MAG: hypothetical protein ACHP65_06615 [Legionellales bacterium]
MAMITVLTHVVGHTKGDFFAGKKLIGHLLTLGHSVEWILKIDAPAAVLPLPIGALAESAHFNYYYVASSSANMSILSNADKLAQRDYFIVFPTITTMSPSEFNELKHQGVNVKLVGEYGQNQSYFANTFFRDIIRALRKYQLHHYFTGVTSNVGTQYLPSVIQVRFVNKYEFDNEPRIFLNDYFPFLIQTQNRTHTAIYGIDKHGLPKRTDLNAADAALYANFSYIHSTCGSVSLTPKITTHLDSSQTHSQQELGMFIEPIADAPNDAMALFFVAEKDQPFIKMLLDKPLDAEISPQDIIDYNQSTSTFFAYTNTDTDILIYKDGEEALAQHDHQLAAYCALGVCRILKSQPERKKIDLIARHTEQSKNLLMQALKEYAVDLNEVVLRLFNPFPLAHETMQAFFKKAKVDQQPVLITGDQSLTEVINIGAPFIYQICHWKKPLAQSLLSFCESLRFYELHDFLSHSFAGDVNCLDGYESLTANLYKLLSLIDNPKLYEQYGALRYHMASIYERLPGIVLDNPQVKNKEDMLKLHFNEWVLFDEQKVREFQERRVAPVPASMYLGVITKQQVPLIARIKPEKPAIFSYSPPPTWWKLKHHFAGFSITKEDVMSTMVTLEQEQQDAFVKSYPDNGLPGISKERLQQELDAAVLEWLIVDAKQNTKSFQRLYLLQNESGQEALIHELYNFTPINHYGFELLHQTMHAFLKPNHYALFLKKSINYALPLGVQTYTSLLKNLELAERTALIKESLQVPSPQIIFIMQQAPCTMLSLLAEADRPWLIAVLQLRENTAMVTPDITAQHDAIWNSLDDNRVTMVFQDHHQKDHRIYRGDFNSIDLMTTMAGPSHASQKTLIRAANFLGAYIKKQDYYWFNGLIATDKRLHDAIKFFITDIDAGNIQDPQRMQTKLRSLCWGLQPTAPLAQLIQYIEHKLYDSYCPVAVPAPAQASSSGFFCTEASKQPDVIRPSEPMREYSCGIQ